MGNMFKWNKLQRISNITIVTRNQFIQHSQYQPLSQ